MSNPRPTAMERLSVAMNSTDLTMYPERRADWDYVTAAGIAGARNGRLAAPLMHLHLVTTQSGLREACDAVRGLVRRMNTKRNWRLNGEAIETVADRALAHHLQPTCPHCQGRGFELIEGAPALSDRACKHCQGSGKRPIQKKHREEIGHVLAVLEGIDDVTGRAVARLVK